MKIYTDMAADLFHYGHVSFLWQVKASYPDSLLLVGVHSDETIFSYKGEMPVMNMDERVAVVRSCRYVDDILEDSPLELDEDFISFHRIDKVVHGDGISDSDREIMYGKVMDIYEDFPRTEGISSDKIKDRIR